MEPKRPRTLVENIQMDVRSDGKFMVARLPIAGESDRSEWPVLAVVVAPAFRDEAVRQAFGDLLAKVMAVALKDRGSTVLAAFASSVKPTE